jgi:hypothetical protein
MENETTFIHLEKKIAAITPTEWDYNFNPDEVLKIDYTNIFGEIITIPVLVNRIGLIVAEMRHYTKDVKIKLDLKEAEVRKLFRNKKSTDGSKNPTVQETEDHITMDPVVKNMRLKLIRTEEDLEKLESMYNAVKDKSYKLNNLSKSLTPQDFEKEIIEGTVNGLMIKLRDKKF